MKIKLSEIAEGNLTQEQSEALQKYFKEGGTWQSLLELKPQEIEEIYAIGYEHYQGRDYEKAIASFSTLIQLNPYVIKYWVAIGAALQAKQEFKEALDIYKIALTLEENHAPTLFYSAQCLYALEKIAECKETLMKLLQLGEKGSHFLDKAREILNLIENEIDE
jgi:type III secretion system low calcium response chaperone LcrH/SycD